MKFFVFLVAIAVFLFLNTEATSIGNKSNKKLDTKNNVNNNNNVLAYEGTMKAMNKVIDNIQKNVIGEVGITGDGMVVVHMSDEAVYVGNGDVGLVGKGTIGKNFVGQLLGLGNCVTDKCGVIQKIGDINLTVGPLGQKIVGFVNGDDGKVGVVTCKPNAICAIHDVSSKMDDLDVKGVEKKGAGVKNKKN